MSIIVTPVTSELPLNYTVISRESEFYDYPEFNVGGTVTYEEIVDDTLISDQSLEVFGKLVLKGSDGKLYTPTLRIELIEVDEDFTNAS